MYCTAAQVAEKCTVWTNAGAFDTTTLPTKATVEGWIADVSAMFDLALSNQWFTVPVTQETALLAMAGQCSSIVADIVQASHSTGRYFTDKVLERGLSWQILARQEVDAWVKNNADGLQNLGVGRRITVPTASIGLIARNPRRRDLE